MVSARSMAVFLLLSVSWNARIASAELLQDAFHRVQGEFCEIVTDLDLGPESKELAKIFDAAVPIWCEIFQVPLDKVRDWRVTVHVMGSRERFLTAGMLPKSMPNFPHGFQWKNDIWIVEQPSAYYRRHLLLHEGTHWFMTYRYGSAGPPWLMEGTAEWLATHRWIADKLDLGWIPRSKSDVPYWGRIAVIQDQLASGIAPSLESILRYDPAAHQNVDAYAWSWAAVLFMRSNPHTREEFERILTGEIKLDQSLNRLLFNRLRLKWPNLRAQWSSFVSDLEFGHDQRQTMLQLSAATEPLERLRTCEISAQANWQGTGYSVAEGVKLRIQASGQFTLKNDPKPWVSEPTGVTIEYYRGQPLGKLMLCVAAAVPQEQEATIPPYSVPVGELAEIRFSRSGEIFFRVNEATSQLFDNTGTIKVELQPIK